MGNCHAADAATVLIQHPNGKLQRFYCSLTAKNVMAANPGHYVALIVSSTKRSSSNSTPSASANCTPINDNGDREMSGTRARVKQMKILRPGDTLRIGYVYHLVSFDEVLREFTSKKRAKLSWLLANDGEEKSRPKRGNNVFASAGDSTASKAVITNQLMPQNVQHQHQQDAEAKLDAELEEIVSRMMLADSTKTRKAGSHDAGHFGVPTARHCQWKPALQSISEVGT